MACKRILSKIATFLTVFSLAACKDTQPHTPELRVMTWTDYLRDDVIKSFEQENHAKVVLDYFSSNEELLAKLQANVQSGGTGWDLILPSDYMVSSMIRLKLLKPFDKSKLNFLSDYDPAFLNPNYDPALQYSVPFAWGTTGIAVNTKLVPGFDAAKGLSWRDLFENPAYKGQVSLLDDEREVLNAALIIQGKNWVTATEADVQNAFAYLKKHKANIKIFTPEARPAIESDECALCQAYSGDTFQIMKDKPGIRYVIPREGATLWADNWARPANAPDNPLAYAFMNKILSVEGSRSFTSSVFYPTPNLKARAALAPQVRDNTGVFPAKDVFEKLAYMPERPELLQLIDRLWTELKSQ